MKALNTAEKAKTTWMLTFGDVVTLLITFFVLMIAVNKGEISQLQKWAEHQIDQSYLQLQEVTNELDFLQVRRTSMGIELTISQDEAFKKGGFIPSEALEADLVILGQLLADLDIFEVDVALMPRSLRQHVQENNLEWRLEINVLGHTDNDEINPFSRLRNNWFLSTMRAQTVMQTLYKASILDRKLFAISGYGEHRPIADNASEEGKAKNRRVEIILTATFERKLTENATSIGELALNEKSFLGR